MTAADTLATGMLERELQATVEGILQAYGWTWHHEQDSRKSKRGLPDVVAVHPKSRRIVFAELKTERGRLTREQRAWLLDAEAAGAECYVWRPHDLLNGTIAAALRAR